MTPCPLPGRPSNFNPPTRKGWDVKLDLWEKAFIQFQSTHPQGVGRDVANFFLCVKYFNPPTRKGWDRRTLLNDKTFPRFQSTHPQGVGQNRIHPVQWYLEFQSTHPQGVGPLSFLSAFGAPFYFNPPTRKGWDSKSSQNELCILYKSNKIALVSSSCPTLSGCHLSINCYLAYFFGANPSKYFCSLHLRTAKLFKHFTAYSHIWQQNQACT